MVAEVNSSSEHVLHVSEEEEVLRECPQSYPLSVYIVLRFPHLLPHRKRSGMQFRYASFVFDTDIQDVISAPPQIFAGATGMPWHRKGPEGNE
jgi:hypothetical protein